MAGVRRTPEMAMFGKGHQVFKITNIHSSSSAAMIVHGDR
ncbi:hypothetical protein CSE899_11247 [Cronobacter sakazakii E899]|nr:hypothetical protein CSE899_11247 [Cronobacter sakazakii E899]